ncbi:MAG: DUF3090 family protein [Anaerolineaceae bacterium]|nr:DUF3090 family protein [Anaerolineaceae bacterium]MBN2677429.1 DUF3090 family protein [Anaerolineaceae bacterium]
MPGIEIEFHPVDDIITNAIGRPGQRVFYIQATKGGELVSLLVEKIQLQALAVAIEQFLADIKKDHPDLEDASSTYTEEDMQLKSPVEPLFRIGDFGLGYDLSEDMIIMVLREVSVEAEDTEERGVVRLWCNRNQLRRLAHWCVELADRGRPICPLCGEVIGPKGHVCPKKNGHKKSQIIQDGQAGDS